MRQIYLSFLSVILVFISQIFFTASSYGQMAISYGTPVVTGINNGVDIANAGAGDTRIFIAQQNGTIRIYDGTATLGTFMTLPSTLFPNPLGGEQGLLSIAFHPQFATNRYFFIWYTASNGNVTLARYRANVGLLTGDPNSGVVLLSIAKPGSPYFTNHNGGKLNFGADGKLYIGTGDGGSGGDPFGNAQNGNSYLGKMLRLDVDGFATSAPFYAIPPDNPFLTAGDGILDEIYALGLRNPWRWSFDRANGSMWIADVGQDVYEEVNYRTSATSSGANYGWKCREGMHNYGAGCGAQTFTEPIFEYDHTTGGQSITGGYVYRGPDPTMAPLLGNFVTTDYISGNVWMIKPDGSFIKQTVGLVTNISSFGEAADGTLYAVRRATNGGLYRITLLNTTPVTLAGFAGTHFTNFNKLNWQTTSESNTTKFVVEYSTNGTDFAPVGEVSSNRNAGGSSYNFQHDVAAVSAVFYRLKIVDVNGSFVYSTVVKLNDANAESIRIRPTYITNRMVNISSDIAINKIQLLSTDGKLVMEKTLLNAPGSVNINLPGFAPGIYILKVSGGKYEKVERVFIQ